MSDGPVPQHRFLEEARRGQDLDNLALVVGERQRGESSMAVIACNDYCRMGYRRSMRKLERMYEDMDEQGVPVPTTSMRTMELWSQRYGWVARAEAYDMAKEAQRNARAEAIMESGFALEHERVYQLNELLKDTIKELSEKGFWGLRKKILKTQQGDEVVSERFFRKDVMDTIRGLMDDLAAETGGRVQKKHLEVSGIAGMFAQAKSFGDEGIAEARYVDVETRSDTDDERGNDR